MPNISPDNQIDNIAYPGNTGPKNLFTKFRTEGVKGQILASSITFE